jgi:hypothetical protein
VAGHDAGGMQPWFYAGRTWDFCGTRFERDEDGKETRWLLFLDRGPSGQDSPRATEAGRDTARNARPKTRPRRRENPTQPPSASIRRIAHATVL